MKYLLGILILLLSLPAHAAVMVKHGRVSANVQAELLRDVVTEIGTQAGLQVSIDPSVVNDTVYANFQDLPMGAAIRKLMEGTDVNFALMADADGNPTAIYVSKSESPGAPPKKLDSRPVAAPARGVVTPVTPQMPPQQPTNMNQPAMPQTVTPPSSFQQPQQNYPQGGALRNSAVQQKVMGKQPTDQKPPSAPATVPTGGSFSGAPPPGAQPARPTDTNPNRPLIQNPNPAQNPTPNTLPVQNNQLNQSGAANQDDSDDDDDDE